MNVLRLAPCLVVAALLMPAGCASDQKAAQEPVGPAPARSDDINSGANKNSDDLNKGNLLNQDVGPNYKINGADNTPPR